jgi:PAS domain S-box-containing protein
VPSDNTHAKPRELVRPRIASYLKSSWYCRWIIILVVTASYFFIPALHHTVVLVLLPIAGLYNLVLMAGSKRGWAVITNQWLMIIVDSLMALALVIYTGGIASPYLLLLGFMIVSGGYWYGVVTSIIIGVAQAAALIAYQLAGNHGLVTLKPFIVKMLVLVTIGIYVAWLTGSERSERDKLITLGTETEKERQQLLALINNMRDAVIVVDNDERIVIYNQAAAALVGSGKDIRQKSINDAVQFISAGGHLAELKMDRDTPRERKDLQAKAPDGSLVSVSVSMAPYIVDRQNHGHVVIIRDISQEKTIDKEREEFIAVASHELRTPLTIAQGNVSFLLSPSYLPQDPEAVGMLNSALRSLQQLSHIISDLTNLSKVESEELDVQLEPLNPVALLHEFESDYGDQAKSKGLQLEIKIDSHLSSATILTSRYVVREILSIYISNAIKFSDKGLVTLGVMNPTDNSAGVTFSVSDTGVGISQSDQKKLFEKFFQSEEYTTRVHGGTGLGLYIARSLATRITARVWFETDLGKGSTFYLWVPPYSRHKQDRGKVAAAETKDFFNTV